jgi:pimeloyl-ACP methyl ester carboxylesterase
MNNAEGPIRIHRDTLENQFSKPEKIRIGGEEVNVYDLSPEKLKTDVPTVLAPGFSATPMAHEQNIIGLAKEGRRVISVDSPHGLEQPTIGGTTKDAYAEVELAKLSAVIQALDERGIEQADVVAHSEGALYMVLATYLYPKRFRNMVLMNPAGMIGKDSSFRVAKGMITELIGQTIAETKRTDSDRYKEKLTNPLIPLRVLLSNLKRTKASINAITDSDIIDMLKTLKKEGIGISIIHGADDKVFPMERIQKEVGKDAITGFYSVRGGHNEIFIRPEQYTNAIDAALDALEVRKKQHPD